MSVTTTPQQTSLQTQSAEAGGSAKPLPRNCPPSGTMGAARLLANRGRKPGTQESFCQARRRREALGNSGEFNPV